ncbi:Hypothetical Protein FCC1311_115162 [Hondaea fermentalgiana]|uniref:Uncharacterized protein n=1 Tax=Hondaea fermentalgiana TaxID=2315210 RepID=A0A2R5H2G7_9STRA|nr:Hypothetical Protein FCC1311_115162 [Hondaea fermentalgiana]|eukprot:GBG35293.1 Hypothetical Protein FCC1311_115162 [Hondaea fermentalgiana]
MHILTLELFGRPEAIPVHFHVPEEAFGIKRAAESANAHVIRRIRLKNWKSQFSELFERDLLCVEEFCTGLAQVQMVREGCERGPDVGESNQCSRDTFNIASAGVVGHHDSIVNFMGVEAEGANRPPQTLRVTCSGDASASLRRRPQLSLRECSELFVENIACGPCSFIRILAVMFGVLQQFYSATIIPCVFTASLALQKGGEERLCRLCCEDCGGRALDELVGPFRVVSQPEEVRLRLRSATGGHCHRFPRHPEAVK